MLSRLNRFLKINNEWLGLPLALLVYLVCPQIYGLIDPAAGSYDIGQLHILSFGVVKVLTASFMAWVGYRLNYPLMYGYFIGPLEKDIVHASERNADTAMLHLVKGLVHLLVYFGYMALAMWAFQTV